MKFKGKPKTHVIDSDTNKVIGIFDGKGYLEIADEKYTERMKKKFTPVVPKKSKATSQQNLKGKEVKKK